MHKSAVEANLAEDAIGFKQYNGGGWVGFARGANFGYWGKFILALLSITCNGEIFEIACNISQEHV